MSAIKYIGLGIVSNVYAASDEEGKAEILDRDSLDSLEDLTVLRAGLALFPADKLMSELGFQGDYEEDDCFGAGILMAERLSEKSTWAEAPVLNTQLERNGSVLLAIVTPEFTNEESWQVFEQDFFEISKLYGFESPVLMEGGEITDLLEMVLPKATVNSKSIKKKR